ncbi:phage portal protein family protein [Chroococcidiopsis sp.]|uniref:phage portal protein family protein n=1 Tax=Chroococcidiopsis sp. TaxID=3088168 RepID=UPI003F2B7080
MKFVNTILAPKAQQLVGRYISSVRLSTNSHREKIRAYKDMLRSDPVTRFCVELINLYMFNALGDYSHSRGRITKDIREQIINSKGSWIEVLKRVNSAQWYGYSWSQVAVEDTQFNRKRITEIYTLDPTAYEFQGDKTIDSVLVYASPKDYLVDYDSGIHIVAGTDLSFDSIHGSARCEAAYPYWELHQLMMTVLAIAGQRQATPILVKKTETNDEVLLINPSTGQPVLDDVGEPVLVSKGWDAIQQLESLGIAGVTAIDPDDEIYAIELKVNNDLLKEIIKYCEEMRMKSFFVPTLLGTTSLSGLGDSSLGDMHLEIFEELILSSLNFLMNEIIEQLIRPLIEYNFGVQSSYGTFEIKRRDRNILELAKVTLDGFAKGVFVATDPTVVNRLRSYLGIEPLDEKQITGEDPQ